MKWVCTVCGYVHEGDAAPEKCPVCKVPADKFVAQEEGKIYRVLFEQGKKGLAVGHTANFIEVAVKTDRHLTNSILPVRLGKNKEGIVEGFLE